MQESINNTSVWQTAAHVVITIILVVPAIYLAGFLVVILDFMQEGYIGRTGDGIGFFMRGLQFFIAGYASLFIPTLLLKRSHITIVCTIFGTVVVLFLGLSILLSAVNPSIASKYEIYDWLGIIASFIGLIVSAFMSKELQD